MLIIANQEIDHAVHHPRSITLARVDAGGKNDRLSHSDVHRVRQKVCHDEHIDVVASEGLTEHGLADLIFVLVRADLVDEIALVGVGEGVAMCKENTVVIVYKGTEDKIRDVVVGSNGEGNLRLNMISNVSA